jgi:hypothetical protein
LCLIQIRQSLNAYSYLVVLLLVLHRKTSSLTFF